MPFSYIETVASGATNVFSVPEYSKREHIQVLRDGVLLASGTDYTWLDAGNVQLTVTPSAGQKILRRRSTPASAMLATQQASLYNPQAANDADKQLLYLAQELEDAVEPLATLPTGGGDRAGKFLGFDASGLARMFSLAAGAGLDLQYNATTGLWTLTNIGVPNGGSGNMVGPASSVDRRIPLLSGTSGKLLIDSGIGMSAEGMPILPQNFGFRNRLINGGMVISQRFGANVQTLTPGALAFTLDRWAAQSIGGAMTVQRILGGGNSYAQLNGASGITSWTFSQPIESLMTNDLVNKTVTLSFTLWGTVAGSLNAIVYSPTAVDTWPGGSVISSSPVSYGVTPVRYSVTYNAGALAARGLLLSFSGGAFISGSLFITDVQLELGSAATPFERLPPGVDQLLSQRYYQAVAGGFAAYMVQNDAVFWTAPFGVSMRAPPVVVFSGYTTSHATVLLSATDISNNGMSVNLAAGASGAGSPSRHFAVGGRYTLSAELT